LADDVRTLFSHDCHSGHAACHGQAVFEGGIQRADEAATADNREGRQGSMRLELLVQQILDQITLPTALLALYLSAWFCVLGLLGLVLLSLWWFVGWPRVPREQPAMSRYAAFESRSLRLKRQEPESPGILKYGAASIIPRRFRACGR
jgi:hypothetical protein